MLLTGESGTEVTVGYINPGSAEIRTAVITRAPIVIEHVTGRMIEGTDVGYIRIEQFGGYEDIAAFDSYYNGILSEAGAESVIIDLRGNPGGSMYALVNMLNIMITEEGLPLFDVVSADGTESFRSTGWEGWDDTFIWRPESIAVLVNGASASASEIFAGVLQKHGMEEVVGTGTFGKAYSQYHIGLSTGDILVTTFSRIELPGIGSYEGVGIVPDVKAEPLYFTGADVGLYQPGTGDPIFRSCRDAFRVLALQQRLAAAGYYRTAPDGVFDAYTLWCLNRFQVSRGIKPISFASVATLEALKSVSDAAYVDMRDVALEKALEICGQ